VSSDDELSEIRAGPRWAAVLTAVADAEAGLEQPLSDDEIDGGWTEELCDAILSDVRRVRDELAAGAGAGVALKDWTGVDVVDPDGDVRADVIFDVDLALGDLERAERLLYEVTRLLGDLASPGSRADVEQGFDDEVRAQLRSMLDELRGILASGEYLSREQMDPWADALRTYGFLRAAPAPGLDGSSTAETGFTLQRIEQFPPGRRWEELAIFDGWLCNVAWTDVLDDVAGGQDDASDDAEDPPD
jgi:hypothetical protein